MRILLDTHILLWLLKDDPQLSSKAKYFITDSESELFFSPVSVCEISIKHRVKPDIFPEVPEEVRNDAIASGIKELPLESKDVYGVGELPAYHKDPFDRMLIAQAKAEQMALMSHDEKVAMYGDSILAV